MDVNVRINWMPGMELTAETFRRLEEILDYKQKIALRAALGNNQLGLLPGSEFKCNGVFVRNTFEIEYLKCLAILPSGSLINTAQEVEVNIPMLYGEEYYLGISISETLHDFEKEEVPCTRPVYDYALYALDDLKKKDVFPVVKFVAKEGVLSMYEDYIVPSLFISENKRFAEFKEKITKRLESLSSHKNMEEGDGKRTFLRYLFQIKSVQADSKVEKFVAFTEELVQAIDYFIVLPHAEQRQDIPVPDFYDIEIWLRWVENYLEFAENVLDKVVLEDNSIDYDALLQQAKKELYEKLRPELLEKLPVVIKKEVYEEMAEKLKVFLPSYIKEKLDEIKKLIGDELVNFLEPKLFDDLYKKLYDALYVAPEEEDEFMPMI